MITIMHRVPYSATNFITYESTARALEGKLSSDAARSWAAGGVSGLVACSVAYPLDLLRTRVAAETGRAPHQQQRRRVSTALRRIIAEQGVRGLYKGLAATLGQVVPGLAFNFCFYDTFKRAALAYQHPHYSHMPQNPQAQRPPHGAQPQQQQQQQSASWRQQDLHLRQQPQQQAAGQSHGREHHLALDGGDGAMHCSEGGVRGGASCTMGNCAGGVGSRSSAATLASTALRSAAAGPSPSLSPSPLTSALCACASGLCTSTITFPLDVVRRRLQVYDRGPLGRLRYRDVVRAVYSEGGLRAFYRGIGPEYAKVLPGMAIAFTTYETLKRLTGAA